MVGDERLFPPAAYIVGAPKCGTTALAAYLSDHPRVVVGEFKEPHFYADDFAGLRLYDSEEAYRASFPQPREPGSALLDGSVFYLMSDTAVSAIQRVRPDARFIVMLRDPVAMAPSMHQQLINSLDEDVTDFEKAWRLCDARRRGERIPRMCRVPKLLEYDRVCALGEQVGRLFAQVPPERRLVMLQDELKADAGDVYRRALAFLGLPDDGRTEFPRINEARTSRSRMVKILTQRPWPIIHRPLAPLKRMLGVKSFGVMSRIDGVNSVRTGGARVSQAMRAELAAHFAEDVARLSELLGRDLVGEFGWLSTGESARIPA
jgi:hypothetical protein